MAIPAPTVELLEPEMTGGDKFKYAAAVSDGDYIYAPPFSAARALRISCRTGEAELIGPEMGGGGYGSQCKYITAALVDGFVYYASRIMRISCSSGAVEFIGPEMKGNALYHCAVVVGKHIIAPPCSADRVLWIDCSTGAVDFLGPVLSGYSKYGAAAAVGGCIYAVPDRASRVLRVDVTAGKVEQIGPDLPDKSDRRDGAYRCAARVGQCVYAFPSDARRVLRVNHATGACDCVGPDLGDGEKKCTAAAAVGERVYGIPCLDGQARRVLRLDTTTGHLDEIGEAVPSESSYSNAVVVGKAVFCIPYCGGSVLRVDDESGVVETIGPSLGEKTTLYYMHSAAFGRGNIYAVPSFARRTLRIRLPELESPPEVPSPMPTMHATSSTPVTDVPRLINRWGMDIANVLTGTHSYFPKGFVPSHTAADCLRHIAFPGQAEVLRKATEAAAMAAEESKGCVIVIFAYTLESALYTQLTASMRQSDEERLKTWVEYIFHLEKALLRQPCFGGTVFRGINVLVPSSVYRPGSKVTWQGFSSGTRQVLVLVQQNFIKCFDGDRLTGTVFVIRACSARRVEMISQYPAEQEVIFTPNTHFQVEEMATEEGRKRELLPDLEDYDLTKLKVFRMTEL